MRWQGAPLALWLYIAALLVVVEATVEDDTVAVHGSGTERSEPEPMGIATRALRTSLRILDAPRDQFDADGLLRVADGFRVMPEGWDASRLQCQSRIQVTCTQQSLESARICRLAYCEQVAGFWVMKVREDNRD